MRWWRTSRRQIGAAAATWLACLVILWLPGSARAQTFSPAIEVHSVQHDPTGAPPVALPATGGRSAETHSLTMSVSDMPGVPSDPVTSATYRIVGPAATVEGDGVIGGQTVPDQRATAASEGGANAALPFFLAAAGIGVVAVWRVRGRRRASTRRPPPAERILRPFPHRAEAADVPARAAPRAVHGLVVVVDRDGNRRTVPLTSRPLTVGSSTACDIVLGDASVRAQHLRITFLSPTEVQVHALGDRGSRPYEGHDDDEWLIAHDGEQILIGSHQLQIVMDAEDTRHMTRAEVGA